MPDIAPLPQGWLLMPSSDDGGGHGLWVQDDQGGCDGRMSSLATQERSSGIPKFLKRCEQIFCGFERGWQPLEWFLQALEKQSTATNIQV